VVTAPPVVPEATWAEAVTGPGLAVLVLVVLVLVVGSRYRPGGTPGTKAPWWRAATATVPDPIAADGSAVAIQPIAITAHTTERNAVFMSWSHRHRRPGHECSRPFSPPSYDAVVPRVAPQLAVPAPVMSVDQLEAFLREVFPQAQPTWKVEEVTETGVRVRQPVGNGHARPGGTVSGPTMMALADGAAWLATLSRIGPISQTVTSSLTINFLRKPPLAADLWADTELVRLGRRQSVSEVRMYSETSGEPVASSTVTYWIPGRPGLRGEGAASRTAEVLR
jgi:uncharacterized protein (TIGR00369 family)